MLSPDIDACWGDGEDMHEDADTSHGFPMDDSHEPSGLFYNGDSDSYSFEDHNLHASSIERAAHSLLTPFFFGSSIKEDEYGYANSEPRMPDFPYLYGAGYYEQPDDVFGFPPPVPPAPVTPAPELTASTRSAVDIVIDGQPLAEVRTRTPSEARTFSVSARVVGQFRQQGAAQCRVSLRYARGEGNPNRSEPLPKDILGGVKLVSVLSDGTVLFDSLSISESSTKHKEREFVLELSVLRIDGEVLARRETRPFYAYSHKKVLQRRGSVKLRSLSHLSGPVSGGLPMHVIGTPFIQGPALSIVFRTPYGDVWVRPSEFFSDSVLFFDLPALPLPADLTQGLVADTECRVQVCVSNDGRTFSNAVDFAYVVDPAELRARI